MTNAAYRNGNYNIRFGGMTVPFALEVRPRKRLTISVHPDRSVTVIAPADRSLDQVIQRVSKRAAWIAKQRAYFEQFHPLPEPKRYVSGETHYYLGRQYRLRVRKGKVEQVKLIGQYFKMSTPQPRDTQRIKTHLTGWYRDHARRLFVARLDRLIQENPPLRAGRSRVVIRYMPHRWGSCTKRGNILLNPDLVKAPLHCIDYVIAHELCHLRYHDHGARFYRLLSRCMPDWEKRKARLDSFVV